MSSATSEIISPWNSDYNAIKTFNHKFSKACYYELKESNTDVISIKPLYVNSSMTNFMEGYIIYYF